MALGQSSREYIEELWVGIRADLSDLRSGLNKSNQEVNTFVGRIGAASGELRTFGKTVGIASGAVLAFGGLATKVFADFEQSIANVASVVGGGREEMDELAKTARHFGEITVFSASQAADAMYFLASAGYNTNQIIGALGGTLNLAAATGSDLASTTAIVVSTLNAFQMEATEATRVSNVFAAIIGQSQATMERLGLSMSYVAPVAAALNIPLEQITASLGMLYDSGLDASTAATSLRMGLIRLLKPTPAIEKALNGLGLTFDDVNPAANDLAAILDKLNSVSAHTAENAGLMAEIFGARAVTAMQVLTREGGTALRELQRNITGTDKASEMAATQLDTLRGAMRLLKSVMEESALIIGSKLAPAIRSLVEVIRDVLLFINSLPEGLQTVVIVAPMAAAAIGLLAAGFALTLSFIPQIITGLATLKVALGVLVSPIGLVGAAIIGLVAVLGLWASAERRQRQAMEENMREISQYIDKRSEEVKSIKELSDEYISLAEKSNRSAQEQERLSKVHEEMSQRYPGLISDTDSYSDSLDKVRKIGSDAADELSRLAQMKREAATIELHLEIADIQKQIREMERHISETTLWEKMRDGAAILNKELVAGLSSVDGIFDEITKKVELVPRNFIRWTKTVEALSLNQSEFSQHLRESITEQSGMNRALKDTEQLTKTIMENQHEINQITGKAKAETRNLSSGEKERVAFLSTQVKNAENLLGVYLEQIKAVNQYKNLQIDLETAERTLLEIGKERVAQKKKLAELDLDVDDKPDGDISDTRDMERQRADVIFAMRKAALENLLREEELTRRESLESAERYAAYELEYKVLMLERERDMLIEQAKAVGENTTEIKKTYDDRILILEREKQQQIQSIREEYDSRDRALLENKLRYESELSDEAAEDYKEYLEQRLLQVEEWGNEYIRILNEIRRFEDNEHQRKLQQGRYFASQMRNLMENLADTMTQGSGKMTDVWKEALKGVIDMFANYYKNILQMSAAAALASGNFARAAAAAAGIAVITAAQAAAKAQIDSAEIGALIKKSGMVQVHTGEQIVPANIVRESRESHQQAVQSANYSKGERSSMKEMMENMQPPSLTINYPMVNDRKFWENVVEDYVMEAWQSVRKRMGEG
jgi:TP901 family phage tail tape measure protein